MALSIELSRRLEDVEEPLPKRMRLASLAFNSPNFPLNTKRNVILKWLSGIPSDPDSAEKINNEETWNTTVINCFKDSFMSSEINREVKKKLLSVLIKQLTKPNINVLDCAVVVFCHNSLIQYFLNDPIASIKFIKCLLHNIVLSYNTNNIIRTEIDNLLQKVVQQIILFSKKSFVKQDFTNNVIRVILPDLLEPISTSNSNVLFNSCMNLLQRTIFDRAVDINASYKVMAYILAEKILTDKSLILLIKSFVHSYKNDSTVIYTFYKETFETVANDTLFVNKTMIEMLNEYEIKLDVEIEKESFLIFLQNFALNIVEKYLSSDTASVLQILLSIMSLNPLIIEPKLHEIIAILSLTEKSDFDLELYKSFLYLSISALLKLNRIHKLASKLLELFRELLKKIETKQIIDINQVWPISAGLKWGTAVNSITSSLILSTLKGLWYYLENDCVVHLEDGNYGNNIILMTQLTCRFIDDFLLDSQLISMTDKLGDTIKTSIEHGFAILSRFAKVVQKKYDEKLMSSFLSSSFSLGEFSLLINYYWKPQDKSSPKPLISNYVDSNDWQLINQQISNFGDEECKSNQNKLLLQDLRANMISSELNQDNTNKSAQIDIILNNLNEMWNTILSSKITAGSVIPLLKQPDLNILTNRLAIAIIDDSETYRHILLLGHIQENRNLLESMLFSVFQQISACFKRKKRKSDQTVFNSLVVNLCKSDDFVISNASLNTEEFLINARQLFESESVVSRSNINLERLQQCLNIINELPMHHFSADCKRIIYLFVIAIMSDLKSADVTADCLARISCENIVISILEVEPPANIMEIVTYHKLFNLSKWLLKAEQILKPILNIAVKNYSNTSSSIKGFLKLLLADTNVLLEGDDTIDNDSIKKTVTIITLLLGLLIKAKKQKLSPENKVSVVKLQTKIVKGIDFCRLVSLLQDKDDGMLHEHLLNLYNYELQCYISGLRGGCIEEAILLLPKFINTALSASSSKLEEATSLITLCLQHRNVLSAHIPSDLPDKTWEFYYTTTINSCNSTSKFLPPIDSSHISKVFEACADFQQSMIIFKLLQNTLSCLDSKEPVTNLAANLWFWEKLVEFDMNTKKAEARQVALTTLCQNLNLFLVDQQNSATADSNIPGVLAVLNIYLCIINNKTVQLSATLFDCILQSISYLDFIELQEINNIVLLFQTCSSLMQAIVDNRYFLILDRLPALLLGLRRMVSALCVWGDVTTEIEVTKAAAIGSLGIYLERISDALIRQKRDFSRMSPYLIFDLIKYLSVSPLLPPVKQSLLNVIYNVLSVCDEYGVSFLKRTLPTANLEVFKNVYSNYLKYQKFTGKV